MKGFLNMTTYNTISLFSGAGGLDTGFEQNGFNITTANEIDKNAAKTYQLNHSNTDFIVGDLLEIIDKFNKNSTDVVIGGPPCQGFSVAGKMDETDPRNKMVWEFLKVVSLTQPVAFVLENVKALYSLSKWKPIREKIISDANAMGYSCVPILLNASEFGVPQKRFRVFFIGIKGKLISKEQLESEFDKRKVNSPTVREAFANVAPEGTQANPITSTAKITYAVKPVLRNSPYSGMLFNGAGRPINLDGFANTLPASMGGNKTPIIDTLALQNYSKNYVEEYFESVIGSNSIKTGEAPSRLRRLTTTEAAVLQTFPSNYQFYGPMTSVYRQIGNAVPVRLASVVSDVLKSILEKYDDLKQFENI